MKYTLDDIQIIDPLEFIRQRPEMFLWRVDGLELASAVAHTALVLTDGPVTVLHRDCWWMIAGEQDWMTGISEDELFARPIPFPEAGVNSTRNEILLTAFATDIIMVSNGKSRVIKGTVAADAEIWQSMRARPEWKRVVAFRLDEDEKK